jgi:hypothetical protein
MTTYAFPSIEASSYTLTPVTNRKVFQSPLTKAVQTAARNGNHWQLSMTFRNKKDANRGELQGFIAQLHGSEHRFTWGPGETIRGTGAGSPLVNGGSASGFTMATDGWGNSQTVLKRGDYFGVNGELKMCTADATTNGSGQVTLSFFPELRESPADNAVITISNPTGIFMLLDDIDFPSEPGVFSDFTINAMEDVFL